MSVDRSFHTTNPTHAIEQIHLCPKKKRGGTRPSTKTKLNQTHLSQRSRHESHFTLGPHALLHVYHASRQLRIASSSSSVRSSVVRFRFRRVVNPKLERDHPAIRVVVEVGSIRILTACGTSSTITVVVAVVCSSFASPFGASTSIAVMVFKSQRVRFKALLCRV